ncbi:Hypothetical predicted protein [Paramuricea clavata]|uniref:DDE Tnp4 domain-containing protein n=1 Tax=Paramuricea clavata TaxID=317549 RepID=A0A6S7IPG5_PARCT|nr:Hypothetical predicted protein [Paramuricea clavata]
MVTNGTLVPEEQELSIIINGKVIEPFLIGDPAYLLSKHLMKDYPGSNLSPEKEYFNYRLNRARIQIERAFGKLKGRWRCLFKQLECTLENAAHHVIASCILHNICEEGDAEYLEEWDIVTGNELEGNFPFLNQDEQTIAGQEAEETRRLLTEYVSHN